MSIARPYLIFLGDAADQLAAKTAQGVKDWRRDWCVGQLRLSGCNADLRLPDMTVAQAAAAGVKTVIVGVANRGGVIGESWIGVLERALELGLDLASGLHKRLSEVPALAEAAKKHGRQLVDVRHPARDFAIGNGKKRTGKRATPSIAPCGTWKPRSPVARSGSWRGWRRHRRPSPPTPSASTRSRTWQRRRAPTPIARC